MITPIESGSHPRIEKSWGHEIWIENNEEYCGKILRFNREGVGTSMHFHVLKRETMLCTFGRFEIACIDTETGAEYSVHLGPGDSVEIPRLTPHRIIPRGHLGNELMEFSTQHYDEDSHRLTRPGI